MHYAGRHAVWLIFLLLPLSARGQEASPGIDGRLPFFIDHFAPQDYQQQPQNWSVVQDSRGVVYVANNDGVLEYDGTSWRLIRTLTNTFVRSLAVDAGDVVYVGVQNDFGYLAPDSSGTLRYLSLATHVSPEERDFLDVWGTHVTSNGVYFQTKSRLFRWDGTTMRSWYAEQGYHTSFVVGDRFYVRRGGVGLQEMVGDSLHLIPDGGRFAEQKIYVMAPFSDGRILIGTREEGLFQYDGISATPFASQANGFLVEQQLYHGCAIPGGYFALATLGGGVVIIDEGGQLVQVLDQATALPDGVVNYVYHDRQGGLWLALNNKGIVRVDVLSPLSRFDRRLGLEGVIYWIQRHRNRLYVATGTGLHRLSEEKAPVAGAGRTPTSFESILDRQVYAVLSADSILFAAADDGLYVVRNDRVSRLAVRNAPEKAFALYMSVTSPGLIYVGLKNGLGTLRYGRSGWEFRENASPITEEVRWITEEEDGTLWLSNLRSGVWRLGYSRAGVPTTFETFDASSGLPEGKVAIGRLAGRAVFVTKEGIFRYDEKVKGAGQPRFYRDEELARYIKTGDIRAFNIDDDKSIWIIYGDRVEILRLQADGSYKQSAPEVLQFVKWDIAPFVHIEPNGVLWLSREDLLIRYDERVPTRTGYHAPFRALVRRITPVEKETVIFGGKVIENGLGGATSLELPYTNNDLRIEYAAPSFNKASETQYQYYLEGRDDGWSGWSKETDKTFTHLEEGTYRFHVRARNAQGVLSAEATFAFRVLPPWFRSWWAYALYAFSCVMVVVFVRSYRAVVRENRLAQEQAEELARERLVNERLQEVNKRLQLANESLTQANQLKDEFLANTSHELRTPLTAILGFTTVLKEELQSEHREFLDLIEENGQRLLQTLNALLDFAKLRAGMMEVNRVPVELGRQAAEVVRLMSPLARKKGLRLALEPSARPVYALLDRHYFERVLYNLIGNAVKFTDEGSVLVEVVEQGARAGVRVKDTGIGIDASFQPRLFEAFKQESSGLTRTYEGSGLGLAITAQLVGLMGGEIEVESEKGKGSVFSVWFPVLEEEPEREVFEDTLVLDRFLG